MLIYYKPYMTLTFLEYFNFHNSTIVGLFKKIGPLLVKKTTIKKGSSLTPESILDFLKHDLGDLTRAIKRKKIY